MGFCAGMAYNWKNYFVGLQAQFNNYSYSKGECKAGSSTGMPVQRWV
jgi:hypothetical protein